MWITADLGAAVTHKHMWKVETQFAVRLGGNTYINTPNLIVYKNEPLFRVRRGDDGTLGIDFDVYDKAGNRIAKFVKGVVVDGDKGKYLIESGHDTYTVKERATDRIVARVQRKGVAGAELDVWVNTYLPNGFLLNAGPTATNLGGATVVGTTFKNCGAGISVA